jgi:hypothetical protein
LIIGAQKAGTTALHDILQAHSKIDAARRKELHFFNNDGWYAHRYRRPYSMLFPPRDRTNRDHLFFEATPEYLYHPQGPARIRAYNPAMKLIVLLREPAARARSAWAMSRHVLNEDKQGYPEERSFAQCVAESMALGTQANALTDPRGYLGRGLYAQQLERVFAHFDRKQVLILENRVLLDAHEQTMEKILNFLGLPREELPFRKVFSSAIDTEQLYPAEMAALKHYFKPHNEALFALLGRDYGWNQAA